MKRILSIAILALILLPFLVGAQGLVPCGEEGNPCQLCDLFGLINNILNWVLFIFVPIVAPIFIVIGGLYMLVARDNPGTLTTGKNVLTAAVIGLIIIYTAWVLLNTVLTSLGVASWTGLGTWWQIECAI
ncbi:MAG: hypothetical protein Q8P55_02410 [bacterium]|nr:hypothetical protein [bacterium]